MTRNIPKIHIDLRGHQYSDESNVPDFSIGTPEWYTWLEQQHSFSFESLHGTFIARKEQRHESRYWYAYCRIHKRLRTAYLGKTEELTLERLNEVARALASIRTHVKNASHELAEAETFYHTFFGVPPIYTRLSVPPLPAQFIARPRLTQKLTQGLSHKFILVSAPAGSGKTTLLSEWVQHSEYPVAWVSLDDSDNDPMQFWSYVLWSLEGVHPGISEKVLKPLRASEPQSIHVALTFLMNSLRAISHDVLLVLDDYHVLKAQLIHETVSFLLSHIPSHVHLVIASRSDPPLHLARLRANGDLFEIHASELRFLSHEIRSFVAQTMNVALSEEMLSILETRTEGWVTGLQLAALSLQGQEEFENFDSVVGSHRFVLDYFIEEVLQRQPGELQSFLLFTSILERLNGPLCDAVTSQSGGRGLLEQVERSHLFLVPLDRQRHWYRYHPLFKEALLNRMQSFQPDLLPELYRRAYVWCAQNELLPEAVQYAMAAGAFEQAAQYIAQIGEAMIRRCEVMTLQTWLDRLPIDLVHAYPQLSLLQAWLLITLGRYDAAEQWLQKAENSLEGNADDHSVVLVHEQAIDLSSQDEYEKDVSRQGIAGRVAALRTHIAAFRGDISATAAQAHLALEYLPTGSLYLRGLSALSLGIAYWLQDDVIEAEQAFTQASVLSQAAENSYVELMATCALAQVQMIRGQRHRAARTSRQALEMASEGNARFLPVAAYAYIGMGQHFYEWNELEVATQYLQEGIALSEQWGNKNALVYGCVELAQVKQALGDGEGADELLQRAEQEAQSLLAHSWIAGVVIAQRARFALAQGNIEVGRYWLQQVKQNYLVIFLQTLMIRVHIAQGQFAEALEIVKQFVPVAQSKGQQGLVILLRILEAIAYQQQSDMTRALRALDQALRLAEPEGYIRIFVNEGKPMAELVSRALAIQQWKGRTSSPVSPKYIKKLWMAFEKPAEGAIHEPEKRHTAPRQSPFESLSEREWEIAQLILEGMSNREIAQRLIVAETTVKWHIRQIFSKLNVRSRSQMMALSRKM